MSNYNLVVSDETGSVSVNDLLKKLGGVQGAQRFLRGQLVLVEIKKKWTESDGVISFTLVSEGLSGPDYIERLEGVGYRLPGDTKDLLRSPNFVPSEKGMVHEVRVLRGSLWDDMDRTTAGVRSKAKRWRLKKPCPDVACLVRLTYSDEDLEAMGLWWIVTMHEPIKNSGGDPGLLDVSRSNGGRWLRADYAWLGDVWSHDGGFAFVLPQTGPKR